MTCTIQKSTPCLVCGIAITEPDICAQVAGATPFPRSHSRDDATAPNTEEVLGLATELQTIGLMCPMRTMARRQRQQDHRAALRIYDSKLASRTTIARKLATAWLAIADGFDAPSACDEINFDIKAVQAAIARAQTRANAQVPSIADAAGGTSTREGDAAKTRRVFFEDAVEDEAIDAIAMQQEPLPHVIVNLLALTPACMHGGASTARATGCSVSSDYV